MVTGFTAELSVSVSDPDGDPLTIGWSIVSQPAPADAQIGPGPSPTVTFDWDGSYTVAVTVDDGRGGVVSDTVDVLVTQTPTTLEVSSP